MTARPGCEPIVCGYRHGERVRTLLGGATGRVHIGTDPDAEYPPAEIRWSNGETTPLDHDITPHIRPLTEDPAAMTDHSAPAADDETVHGYRHGDRVRDRRDGSTGRVRIIEPDADSRADGIDYARAELVFDDLFIRAELDEHQAQYLELLGDE
ncbi:hypothetical protein [Nocardia wallacei]|uniref:hypothetical protein n=1 Tax=Nocardia wallacei TaxID=480035 RepID=UPI002455FEBF|nr:hypothetical protein [Nocardia wallacei]